MQVCPKRNTMCSWDCFSIVNELENQIWYFLLILTCGGIFSMIIQLKLKTLPSCCQTMPSYDSLGLWWQLIESSTYFLFLKLPSVDFEAIFESFQLKLTTFLSFFSSFLSAVYWFFFNWAVTFWQLTLNQLCPTFVSLNRAEARLQFRTLDALDGGGGALVPARELSIHDTLWNQRQGKGTTITGYFEVCKQQSLWTN